MSFPLKGQAIRSVVSVVLLVAATLLARPDRNPLAWLLKRPDRVTLIWMAGILAGLPILVGISRLVFVAVGASPGTERVLSLALGTPRGRGGRVLFLPARAKPAVGEGTPR